MDDNTTTAPPDQTTEKEDSSKVVPSKLSFGIVWLILKAFLVRTSNQILKLFSSNFNKLLVVSLASVGNLFATMILGGFTDFNKGILLWFFLSFGLIAVLSTMCVHTIHKQESHNLMTRL